jgi:GNAT superfamily N-acetyltransferase
VREWEPAAATDQEIGTVIAALNAALAADLPGDPSWRATGFREYLSETMPGERRFCWLAEPEGGEAGDREDVPAVMGHATVLLLNDIGVVDVLVHPSTRQRGVGRALVAAAVRRAYAEGMAAIGVEVVGGTPAMKFWEALGFRCAYVEMRYVLDLAAVDWPGLGGMAASAPDGYRLEYHPDAMPASLLEPYAVAKAVRREGNPPDLDLRPSSYDARRLAASLDTLRRRGMRPHLVLAVHGSSGDVAALTEVVVPTQHPTRADQYDTIVVPAHQGLGLERAVKARMLMELRAAEPQLTEVQTWNALENDPIAVINAELGYRPDREWCEYEADVLDLVNRLGH